MLQAVFSHAYFILIPLAILEGPLLAVACGVAAGLDALNPFIAYAILIGGDLGPDLMYYSIGRWGATLPFVQRYASRIKAIRENFLSLEQFWRRHPLATMASAKLSYLVSPALIVSAGLSGMPLQRFLFCSLVVSTLYLGALAALGFGFAKAYGFFHLSLASAGIYLAVPGIATLCGLGYVTVRMGHRMRGQSGKNSNLIRHPSHRSSHAKRGRPRTRHASHG
jgi:membrane protein DedA with SNARE-associated domain